MLNDAEQYMAYANVAEKLQEAFPEIPIMGPTQFYASIRDWDQAEAARYGETMHALDVLK